jgi:putative chitinase
MQPLRNGLTASLLRQAVAGVNARRANDWVAALNAACRKYEITHSLRRMAAFLGHIAKESKGLRDLEENMNYKNAQKANHLFRAFKTDADAEPYLSKPEAFANKVYANQGGNGNEASGDGWRYRGRGFIHLTHKNAYKACGRALGADIVKNPELVATPQYAALSAAWFWRSRGLNELADAEMYQALSLRINRKLDSFPEREANRKRALEALCRSMVMDLVFATVRFGRF